MKTYLVQVARADDSVSDLVSIVVKAVNDENAENAAMKEVAHWGVQVVVFSIKEINVLQVGPELAAAYAADVNYATKAFTKAINDEEERR